MKLDEMRESKFSSLHKSDLSQRVARLTRICENLEIPVLIMVDGFESSGKGHIINELTKDLNPKFFDVEVFENYEQYDDKFPFTKRFVVNTPQKGHIKVFDRSFYFKLFEELNYDEDSLDKKIASLEKLEKMLYDDQMIIIKFFLNVSQKEQKERIDKLQESNRKSFYISKNDEKENKNYEEYKRHFDKILELTDFKFSPWHIIDSDDLKEASKEVLGITLDDLTIGIERIGNQRDDNKKTERNYNKEVSILGNLDLNKSITDKEYEEKKKRLQSEISDILFEYYDRSISTVLVFEGVDAAGKDGAIERLIKDVDPRLYKVHAISAPNEEELSHHYLWRFYKKLPMDGDIGIFSRSRYGRVMVERVEGFATTNEWDRAYDEIGEMESEIHDHGSLILKFFVVIDRDEEYQRFMARENNPDKMYKITDEDWRNRNKRDYYIKAMDEMLDRTNFDYAPWIIVEGNDKKYARIKVMEEFLKYAKRHLKKLDEDHR